MPMDVFGQALNEMRTKLSANDDLMKQKAMLLQQLYDKPLNPDEKLKLTPSQRSAVDNQDRNMIDMEVRLINDTVQGRADTLDKSISYLTDTYQKSIDNAEKQKSDAQTLVYQFVQQYGDQAGAALKALYGPDKLQQLKDMGIDIAGFEQASLPTINQERYGTTPSGDFTVTIPQGTIAAQTNNPLNIKYSDTMAAMGAQDSGITATDGGTFSSFGSPEEGLQAGIKLLQRNYSDLTVEQAMNQWSNGGYGAEISNLNSNQLISSLSDTQLRDLAGEMAKRESGATISGGTSGWNVNDASMPPAGDEANTPYGNTGRTPNDIWQSAITLALDKSSTPQKFLGGLSGSSGPGMALKNAITNKSAALVTAAGVNQATLQQEFAANSKALAPQVTFLNNVQRALQGAEKGAQLTQQLFADKGVNVFDATYANKTLNDLTKLLGNSSDIRAYQAAMTEIGNEYAQVFARGGQRSVEGNKIAQNIIDGNMNLADIQTSLETLQQIGQTVVQTSIDQVASIAGGGGTEEVAKFLAVINGANPPSGSSSGNSGNAVTMSNQDLLNSIPGL
jgi:hypothetical protein